MSKHKSEDYKIIAVKYYLENDTNYNYTKTCEIFKCSERSLKRWIERYEEFEEIKRLSRKPKSYRPLGVYASLRL
jgi:transposase